MTSSTPRKSRYVQKLKPWADALRAKIAEMPPLSVIKVENNGWVPNARWMSGENVPIGAHMSYRRLDGELYIIRLK